MLDAVRQCDALIKITDPGGFAQPATELTATQGRIIDALRTLLDVARQAQTEALAEMTKRPGGDLPDDVTQEARRRCGTSSRSSSSSRRR